MFVSRSSLRTNLKQQNSHFLLHNGGGGMFVGDYKIQETEEDW